MEFRDRQLLRLGKRSIAFVVVAALTSLMLASAGPAQAKRISATKGADKIVGAAQADVTKSEAAMTASRAAVAAMVPRAGPELIDSLEGAAGTDALEGAPPPA